MCDKLTVLWKQIYMLEKFKEIWNTNSFNLFKTYFYVYVEIAQKISKFQIKFILICLWFKFILFVQ